MTKTSGFLTTCAIAALGSSAASGAVTLLDDHFNDGALGTNPGTGGGFGVMGNGTGTAGSVTESGSQARIVEGTSTNTYGILSSNAFDLSNSSQSYTVSWTVAQWTSAGATTQQRRTFFTLQSNNSWLFSTAEAEASRVSISIDERLNQANLQYQNRSLSNPTNPANFFTGNFPLDSGFAGDADGFTVTLVLDSIGYTFTTTGLATTNQVNLAGTWAALGTDFATVLGTDGPMHVGTYIQNGDTTGANLDIDRITVTSIPEPAGATLLAMSGLCAFVRRRR